MTTDDYSSLKTTAETDNPEAQFKLGQLFEFGKGVEQSFEKAMIWYQKSAEAGNTAAQYNLGLLYEHGRGTEKNYTKAAQWYTKASEFDDPWAKTNLAFLYSHGRGVEQSDNVANKLYREAAETGHFQAQYNLAARYASGRGFEPDLIAAHFWFERSKLGASALNQERASKMIKALTEHMTEENLQEANEMFASLLRGEEN